MPVLIANMGHRIMDAALLYLNYVDESLDLSKPLKGVTYAKETDGHSFRLLFLLNLAFCGRGHNHEDYSSLSVPDSSLLSDSSAGILPMITIQTDG